MRGGLSLPKRQLSGTWEPETPMQTEKPQVEEPRGREYGSGVSGSDCPIVVKKRGNARGAKGAGHSRPNQFRSTGNRRSRTVRTEGSNLQWAARARVTGDSQARICERLGVKFPGPTRPGVSQPSAETNAGLPIVFARVYPAPSSL
jgi:hypothetical protein